MIDNADIFLLLVFIVIFLSDYCVTERVTAAWRAKLRDDAREAYRLEQAREVAVQRVMRRGCSKPFKNV
jgi:hypothetical protein